MVFGAAIPWNAVRHFADSVSAQKALVLFSGGSHFAVARLDADEFNSAGARKIELVTERERADQLLKKFGMQAPIPQLRDFPR